MDPWSVDHQVAIQARFLSRFPAMSKQTQIPLDFGPEPQSEPSVPVDNREVGSDPARPYMAAGGVGVRIKSYKQTKPATPAGDLFGNAATELPAAADLAGLVTEETKAGVEASTAEPNAPATGSLAEPAVTTSQPQPVAEAQQTVADAPNPIARDEQPIAEVQQPTVATPNVLITARSQARSAKKIAPQKAPSKRGRKSLKDISAEADLIEIPVDEVLFSKQYYTMGEVSEMFRVNQSLLRFWETEFDILQPRKNKKGDRHFRPVDIKNLHLIYHLLRQKKYTIEGAKDFLKTNKKADERFAVIQRLQQIKAFLLEWKAQL